MKCKRITNIIIIAFMLLILISCKDKKTIEPKYYLISFITNCETLIDNQKVEENKFATRPQITKTGYILSGWYTNFNYNEIFIFEETPITKSMYLYAKWEEIKINSFTVTFETNFGATLSEAVVEEQSLVIKPQDPTRSGYIFDGWYVDEMLINEYSFSTPITTNITLYAKWVKEETPIDNINYLSMPLYGDDAFVKKMRESISKTTLTENTIYVSTTGNDQTATGKIDNPYKSINKAIEKAAQNISQGNKGVVCVRAGDYVENVSFNNYSGNEENYLTLTTYLDEVVRIVGTSASENVDFTKSNYIIMEGFTICDNIKDKDPVAIRMDQANNHIIFKNNTITNVKVNLNTNEKEPCGFLIYMNGTLTTASHNNVLFYQNYLYDNQTGWSEALEVVGNCEYINIIDNVITNCGNIGIDVGGNFGYCSDKSLDQARYVVIRGNDVSNCKSYYATSYAIYVDGARDVLIESNKAYDSLGGIEIGSEEKVTGYEVENIVVRNNLVYNNIENGITVGGYDKSVGIVKNVKIYNNTIVNNAIGYPSNENEFDCNGQLTISMVDGVEICNNIFYTSRKNHALIGGYLDEKYCKNIIFKNNIYFGNIDGDDAYFEIYNKSIDGFNTWCTKTGETGIYANPSFVDLENLNFMLLENSPAIDFGDSKIDAGEYDLLLLSRIKGIIDLGCYEYQN